MQRDNQVFKLIGEELYRQRSGIELIASENFTSLQVMQAMGNVMTNKYAEGYPGRRYYGGCEIVDQTEQLAIDRLKKIFDCDYANVQPHSGAQANAAVCLAVLQPGDSILGLDLSMGGHLTHGSPVNFSGKLYRPVFYGVKKEDGRVDYDMMEKMAKQEKPKLIICGASAYSRDWDYELIRQIVQRPGVAGWVIFAEIVERIDEAAPEQFAPDAIDQVARELAIARIRHEFAQFAAEFAGLVNVLLDVQVAGRDPGLVARIEILLAARIELTLGIAQQVIDRVALPGSLGFGLLADA